MKHFITILALLAALLLVPPTTLHAAETVTQNKIEPSDDLPLNFHLMHPGGDSAPGDPNAAFHLDGTYHLHYIPAHPWKEKKSFWAINWMAVFRTPGAPEGRRDKRGEGLHPDSPLSPKTLREMQAAGLE